MVDTLLSNQSWSVFDRYSWESFILPIMELSDSQHCHVVLLNKELRPVDGIATSKAFNESDAFHAHIEYLDYAGEDQRLKYFPTVVSGKAVNHQSLFLDQEMEKTSIYNEFLVKYNCDNQAFIRAGSIDGCEVLVSIMRDRTQGIYSNDELEIIARFIPSITNNIQLTMELNHHRLLNESYLDILNQQALGVVFLSGEREILETNDVAQSILKVRDGVSDSNRIFRLISRTGDQKLVSLLNATSKNALSTPIFVKRKKQPGFLKILVKKITQRSIFFHSENAQFIALISEVQPQIVFHIEEFKELFQLTKAELDLVIGMANGHTLNQYASLKHISKNTVRWTLTNVFSKTQTNSQLDLQRLLTSFSI